MSERANEKIKLVLQNILDKHSLGEENLPLGIKCSVHELCFWHEAPIYARDFEAVSTSELNSILKRLEEEKIITGTDYVEDEECYWITFPENFRVVAQKQLNRLSVSDDFTMLTLYLDSDGSFWHSDRAKYCYQVSKKRLAILKYLIDNEGFQSTESIAKHTGSTDVNTRNEINKMRAKISNDLGIEGTKIIESDGVNGYRMNPKCNLVLPK